MKWKLPVRILENYEISENAVPFAASTETQTEIFGRIESILYFFTGKKVTA